jgi:hypothetical protein
MASNFEEKLSLVVLSTVFLKLLIALMLFWEFSKYWSSWGIPSISKIGWVLDAMVSYVRLKVSRVARLDF